MTLPDDNERGRPDDGRTTSRSDGEKLKPTLTPRDDTAGTAGPLSARLPQAAAEIGGTYTATHEPSAWLHGRLADVRSRLLGGQIDICPRVHPHADGFVALWRVDWMACGWPDCGHCDRRLALTATADATCDRCARVVDVIHPELVIVGEHRLVTYALCSDCSQREGQ